MSRTVTMILGSLATLLVLQALTHADPDWVIAHQDVGQDLEETTTDMAPAARDEGGGVGVVGKKSSERNLRLAWVRKTGSDESSPRSLDQFTYIQLDDDKPKWGDYGEPEWLRYFGLDARDLNGDGYQDVISGRSVYLNPGGDMSGSWKRVDLGTNVDAMLATDVDGDANADLVAQALPDVYWMEAANTEATEWTARKIGTLPKTGHVNGQGYRVADIFAGGKPEVLLTAEEGIYACEIPDSPETATWEFLHVAVTHSDEGFAVADITGDGHLDIAAGERPEGGDDYTELHCYINPGQKQDSWRRVLLGNTEHAVDRVEIADLNGDGRLDVAISEERYPGREPDANLFWFECPQDPLQGGWQRHRVVTQYSMNNLDAADMDGDGDIDLVTNEHMGEEHKTQIFANDGSGNFAAHTIDTGKECHLGTQIFDLDGDGDLDIVGQAWNAHQFMHLWRNDAIQ